MRVYKFAYRVNKPYPIFMPVNSYFVSISEDGILGGFFGVAVATLAHFLSEIVFLASPKLFTTTSSGDSFSTFLSSMPFICCTGIVMAVIGGVLGGIAIDFLIRRHVLKPNRASVALGGGIVSSLVTMLIIRLRAES